MTTADGDITARSFFKVPADQRNANPEAYQPHLFSFGVYPSTPRGSTSRTAASLLQDGNHFKQIAAASLLDDTCIRRLVDLHIAPFFSEIRSLYVEIDRSSQIDSAAAARGIALDGITILASTILQQTQQLSSYGSQSSLPLPAPLIYPIARMAFRDALLLENQFPIIVIKYALDNVKPNIFPSACSIQQILNYYCDRASPFPGFRASTDLQVQLDSTHKMEPLLSYIYDRLTEKASDRAFPDPAFKDALLPSLPTASHLARCGVKFHPCELEAFRGISFDRKKAVLNIPKIKVNDDTVRFLHNLLAYEATSRFPFESYVISFTYFMDRLIDSSEDVCILVEAGVVINMLGSNEKLASMWNNLCNSVSCRTTHPDRAIMGHLEELAKSRLRRWKASLEEKYWEKQPWLLLSIVTAIILLVLTLLQTIYAIAGSHH